MADEDVAASPPQDPLFRELYELDRERAAARRALDDVTERLRDKIVEVDRARSDYGMRSRIVNTVRSLARDGVLKALTVADITRWIGDALRGAEIAPETCEVGMGMAGQVVLALASDPRADDPVALAARIRSALRGAQLVLVPEVLRKPTRSEQEQDEALAVLAQPGGRVAVVKAPRGSRWART